MIDEVDGEEPNVSPVVQAENFLQQELDFLKSQGTLPLQERQFRMAAPPEPLPGLGPFKPRGLGTPSDRFVAEQQALRLLGGTSSLELFDEIKAHEARVKDLIQRGEKSPGFTDPLGRVQETAETIGGFFTGVAGIFAGERGGQAERLPSVFPRGVNPSFGEGILFNTDVATEIRRRILEREDVIRRNLSAGHRMEALTQGLLVPEVDPSDPINALFFASPPGALALGGLSAFGRELAAIRGAPAAALRRTPTPVLDLGKKWFFTPEGAPKRQFEGLINLSNRLTRNLTDHLTDVNNVGVRSRAAMREIQAAGEEKILASQAEMRSLQSRIRDAKTAKEKAELSTQAQGIAEDIRLLRQLRMTNETIALADVEVYANLLPGMQRVWAREVRDTLLEFARLAKGDTDYAEELSTAWHMRDVARNHPERNIGRGVGKGAEAVENLAQFQLAMAEEIGPTRFANVVAAAKVFSNKNRQLLLDDIEAGLTGPELGRTLRELYPNYIPIRYLEQVTAHMGGTGGGVRLSNISQPVKRLKDIVDEAGLVSPVHAFTSTYMQRRLLQWQNRTAKAFVTSLHYDPRFAGQIARVRNLRPVARITRSLDDMEGRLIGLRRRREAALEAGNPTRRIEGQISRLQEKILNLTLNGTNDVEEIVFRPSASPGRGQVAYLEGGKRQFYSVPSEVEEMVKVLRTTGNSAFFGIPEVGSGLAFIQAPFRAVYTGINPAFFTQYFFLDSVVAMMTSGVAPQRIGRALVRNLVDIFKTSDEAKTFWRSGGSMSGVTGKSAAEIQSLTTTRPGFIGVTQQTYRNTLGRFIVDPLETLGQAFENAPRRAVFERGIERGQSIERAALEAKRVTIDFDRGGAILRELNKVFLYLNAGVQGAMIVPRAARAHPALFAQTSSAFLVSEMLLYAWNRQFPEYQDIPADERYGMLLGMLPWQKTDERGNVVPQRIGIPLREFSILHAPIVRILETLDGQDKTSFDEFAKALLGNLNPLTSILGEGNTAQVPTQLGESVRELAENRNAFFDAPIIPDEFIGRPNAEQFDQNTSEVARRVGALFNISPFRLDFMLERGIMRDAIGLADMVILQGELPDITGVTDPQTKAQIYGWAAELEALTEMAPPEDVGQARIEFFTEVPAEHHDNVERIARQSARIPFLTTIRDRFYKQRGGQLFFSAREEAQAEFELSAEQSRLASQDLGGFMELRDMDQNRIDTNVLERHITPNQWIHQKGDVSKAIGMKFSDLAFRFPASTFALSSQDSLAYRTMIHSLLGTTEDKDARGEILLAGYRAIDPPFESPGVINYDQWKRDQDAYIESLIAEDRAILDGQLLMRLTPVERKWARAQHELEPYFSITTRYLEVHPVAQAILEEIRLQERLQNFTAVDQLRERQAYVDFKRETADEKLRLRKADHFIDATLRFWGITSTTQPNTPAQQIAEAMTLR